MSVPPDIMKLMGGGSLEEPIGGMQSRPGASPMAMPTEREGLKESARVKVQIAASMLEQALPAYDTNSDEFKDILNHLERINKRFGKRDSSDLIPAEIFELVQNSPQVGGGSDMQKMMAQQLKQQLSGQPQQQPQQPQQQPMQGAQNG